MNNQRLAGKRDLTVSIPLLDKSGKRQKAGGPIAECGGQCSLDRRAPRWQQCFVLNIEQQSIQLIDRRVVEDSVDGRVGHHAEVLLDWQTLLTGGFVQSTQRDVVL